MGTFWAFIKMLVEWWEAIKIAIGMAKKAQHDHEMKNIDDAAKRASDPDSSLEERMKAAKEIEDEINSHT